MTKIKLCGLRRLEDIDAANSLRPEFIGFVFAPKSRRRVTPEEALSLRRRLAPDITAVGVFVREAPERIAALLKAEIIDMAQLHGGESDEDVEALRALTDKPIIQAFRIDTAEDMAKALNSRADYILLDSGTGGTGSAFDWSLVERIARPWFLAGGLTAETAGNAVRTLRPWAVDVSSGIETDGVKDPLKMKAFTEAVRAASGKEVTV